MLIFFELLHTFIDTPKLENSIYREYLRRLKIAYIINIEHLDINQLALLNPFYKMSQEEFDALTERNIGNHTMETVLINYAKHFELSIPSFMSKEEKEQLALEIHNTICDYLNNPEKIEKNSLDCLLKKAELLIE